MPITKSAKKSLKTSLAKKKQNDKARKSLEIAIKGVKPATLAKAVSLIDKAVKNHIIHRNKANRLKSRLSKKVGTKEISKRTGAGTKVKVATPTAKKTTKPKTKSAK